MTFRDPYDVAAGNPYMTPMPTPDWRQVLSNALIGVGAGISGADASGRGWGAGIAPGLMMGANLTGQQQQNAMQYQMMAGLRQAQEQNLRDQIEQRRLDRETDERLMASIPATTGLNYQPPAVRMGPGTYSNVVASGESGGRYDIPNAKGSGAYGKYQFMPATWADVATKNPNLGLPFNMRQATPEQQEAAFNTFTASNAADLQKAGVQPTPENLYYAHRFGVEGAKRFIMAPPETPIPQLFPDWVAQNPDLNTTVGQFRLAQQGRFNGVAAPGNPQIVPTQMPGTVQPPRVDPMQYAPLTMSKRLGGYGRAMIDIGNQETQRYLADQEREQKRAQFDQEQRLREQNAAREERNAKVGMTGPNQALIDADARSAAAKAEAEAKVKLENEAAITLSEKEMQRYSDKVRPPVEGAVSGLNNLYQMKRLAEGNMASGTMIDARMLGARVLDTVGLRPMPDGMVNTTEFINRASKQTLDILKTGALGSGTGISGKDLDFVNEMSAKKADFTKEELARLVDIAIDASHGTVKNHNEQIVPRMQKLAGVGKIDPGYFNLKAPTYEEWAKANPPAGTKVTQMGSTYTPSLDPTNIMQNIAQPKDKAAYDALPPGTPYLHPDGTFKMKPKGARR